MKLRRIRWTITIGSIVLIIAHQALPQFSIDTTSLILLVIALVPWLAPVIKSIELPGGIKIEVQDVKEATDKVIRETTEPSAVHVADQGLTEPAIVDPLTTLRELADTDPNLAMVGFRIEIERRLATLAGRYQIDTQRRSAGQLLRALLERKAIPRSVASGLSELIALGNQAAHGADVSRDAARWMLEVGPTVLTILDRTIADREG